MGKNTRPKMHDPIDRMNEVNPMEAILSSKTITQVNSESISTAPVTPQIKTTAANKNPELVRKTYYYTPEIIKAISVVAALQGKDKSQLVREILMDSELIKEYIEKIKTL